MIPMSENGHMRRCGVTGRILAWRWGGSETCCYGPGTRRFNISTMGIAVMEVGRGADKPALQVAWCERSNGLDGSEAPK